MLRIMKTRKMKASNPKCDVGYTIVNDRKPAQIALTYLDGSKQTFNNITTQRSTDILTRIQFASYDLARDGLTNPELDEED
jgi:hypothetical protein